MPCTGDGAGRMGSGPEHPPLKGGIRQHRVGALRFLSPNSNVLTRLGQLMTLRDALDAQHATTEADSVRLLEATRREVSQPTQAQKEVV